MPHSHIDIQDLEIVTLLIIYGVHPATDFRETVKKFDTTSTSGEVLQQQMTHITRLHRRFQRYLALGFLVTVVFARQWWWIHHPRMPDEVVPQYEFDRWILQSCHGNSALRCNHAA